jgi:branched-chain amino acid transport system ATP-binding protein
VAQRPARPDAPHWTPERLFSLFPNLGGHARPAGRCNVGRRAADADDRAHADGQSKARPARRALGRLAPVIIEEMAKTILALKAEGLTVLLSEQNLHFAGNVADRAAIIEKGMIRFIGTMAELKANEAVRTQYLSV